jgi:type I restriction enzyme S subunit
MELKKGYKQTEVGIIPEDWEVKTLSDLTLTLASGVSSTNSQLNGSIPVYGSTGVIGYRRTPDYKGERILVARVGANAGKVHKVNGAFCVSDNTLIINLQPAVNFQFVHDRLCFANLNLLTFGSGQPLITGTQLKQIQIPLPPTLAEQTAIATVLSDTDDLISSLERLIAKKQAIKQGAMQELLKPKEGWITKKLGEVAEIVTGSTPATNVRSNYGNEYLFVGPGDLGNKWVRKSEKSLSEIGFQMSRKIPYKSILFTCIGSTIGKCSMASKELTTNQQINSILPNSAYNSDYLYYQLGLMAPMIKSSAGEQAVPLINKTEFSLIRIPLPPIIAEQVAIAETLSNMDADIQALSTKLQKLKSVKQGMMQELLTGKTRLVKQTA